VYSAFLVKLTGEVNLQAAGIPTGAGGRRRHKGDFPPSGLWNAAPASQALELRRGNIYISLLMEQLEFIDEGLV
jgi:hypothetical protein